MFPPGTSVIFICSTGAPALLQIIGCSEHGDAYRCITYEREGKTVLHDCASVHRVSLPNHHPRVLPEAFLWKMVAMFRSSRSNGAGPRNLRPATQAISFITLAAH